MGCLYLEVEGQPCLVGSVDQGLMKNRQVDLLDRMTQKRTRKKTFLSHIFPIATLPGIFQHITPQKSLQSFRPKYRLSIVIGLSCVFCFLFCFFPCTTAVLRLAHINCMAGLPCHIFLQCVCLSRSL